MTVTPRDEARRRRAPVLRFDLGRPAQFLIAAIVVGVAGGAVTYWAQGVLPDWMSLWANSPAPWAAFALFAGLSAPRLRLAPIGGVLAQWGLVFGYYELADTHTAWWNRFDPVWLAAGVLSGVVFGFCGWYCRSRRPWVRRVAIALLPAIAIGTSIEYGLRTDEHYGGLNVVEAVLVSVAAVAAVVASTRSGRERLVRGAVAIAFGLVAWVLEVLVLLPLLDLGFALT